ncbi:MAG: hypothetical protein COA88_01650 [Kordia sp.]|nr:MAG: hypothetical protein COA88_01650 [Kordia sp.]
MIKKLLLPICIVCFALLFKVNAAIKHELSVTTIQVKETEPNIFIETADIHFKKQSFTKAIEYYKRALNDYSYRGNKRVDEIYAYKKIGECYLGLNIFDEALSYTLKALKMSQEIEDKINISTSLNALALIYYNLEEYQEALDHYSKALALIENQNNDLIKADILSNIGITYGSLNQLDESLEYFNKSLIIKKKIGDKNDILGVISNIGLAYQSKGNLKKALNYFNEGLNLYQKDTTSLPIAYINRNLAIIYFDQKEYQKAEIAIKKCLEIAKTKKNNYLLESSYGALSAIYKGQNKFEKSLEYHELYLEVRSTTQANEVQNRATELMAIYNFDKKEKEIESLKKENEINSIKIRWFFIALLFVSTFSVTLYYYYNRLKRANKDLFQINLEQVDSEERRNKMHEITAGIELISDDKNVKQISSELSKEYKDALIHNITKLFEGEKIFLEHDLSLGKVSERLESNKSYVSRVINEFSGKNFNTFINEYRINEARKLLTQRENWNLTIESIADMVGFKSKSSFNIAFKKFTGITPSYFLESIKEKYD